METTIALKAISLHISRRHAIQVQSYVPPGNLMYSFASRTLAMGESLHGRKSS